jgi:hypothetical protein
MKKVLIALVLGICLLATTALATSGTFTAGWTSCNPGYPGSYGGWDQDPDHCRVSWDGVIQPCIENNRDATFTVGQDGYYTTSITIKHLDGVAETSDGFKVCDGPCQLDDSNVVCSFADITLGTETWKTLECPVNFNGVKTLTFHPTATLPWSDCGTWGQVAVESIDYELGSQIPEFSAIAAGLALAGAATGFVLLRKRK